MKGAKKNLNYEEQIAKVYEKGLIVCTKGIKFFVLRAFSPEEEVDLAWIGFR